MIYQYNISSRTSDTSFSLAAENGAGHVGRRRLFEITSLPREIDEDQNFRLIVAAKVRGSPGVPWIELVEPRLSKTSV